jgi:hypothetical protein
MQISAGCFKPFKRNEAADKRGALQQQREMVE